MNDVIILAGGRGTRLSSIVNDRPKPMALVQGIPLLAILIRRLEKQGVRRIIISTGHMGSIIHNYFKNFHSICDLKFSHEDSPLGTGGAIRLAFGQVVTESAFIINGDTFLDLDFQELNKFCMTCSSDLIMVGAAVKDTARYGALEIENGVPCGFYEKGLHGPGWINGGAYHLPKAEMFTYRKNFPFSFEERFLVPKVSSKSFALFAHEGIFIDIGVPEDYERAQTLLNGQI